MDTISISLTNAPIPLTDTCEVIARRWDSNIPTVVMDWAEGHLWIDPTNYSSAQMERIGAGMQEAISAGAEAVGRFKALAQLREDLRER